jgi:ABC-2 type transport system ATP-binding protein
VISIYILLRKNIDAVFMGEQIYAKIFINLILRNYFKLLCSIDFNMFVIETENLTKDFNGLRAVDSVNLKINQGELFGLLGPNGAGKTTLISMLATILRPTSGSARLCDHDIVKNQDEVRACIGIVFQDPTLDDELHGKENLDLHGRLYHMNKELRKNRIKELLDFVGLTEKANIQVKKYSGGMKRRLEIARGLMHTPKVLFLDEPTLGLDPQTRRNIWDFIKKLRDAGTTIILTTHYMEEADYICDRVAIIDHGKIVALDSPKNLKKKHKAKTLEDVFLKYTGRFIRDEEANPSDRMRERIRARMGH